MQHNAFLMNGTMVHEETSQASTTATASMTDPIRFQKRIKVTLNTAANHLSDDWSSTAYWYQTLPSPELDIDAVEERLPLRPRDQVEELPLPKLTPAQQAARAASAERMQRFTEARDAVRNERRTEIDQWEKANAEQAREIRQRFLAANSVPVQ
jgi:hypothetical protein